MKKNNLKKMAPLTATLTNWIHTWKQTLELQKTSLKVMCLWKSTKTKKYVLIWLAGMSMVSPLLSNRVKKNLWVSRCPLKKIFKRSLARGYWLSQSKAVQNQQVLANFKIKTHWFSIKFVITGRRSILDARKRKSATTVGRIWPNRGSAIRAALSRRRKWRSLILN